MKTQNQLFFRTIWLFVIPLFTCACTSMSGKTPWADRYQARSFPSIFQAWAPAENLHEKSDSPLLPLSIQESSLATTCRHDLIWSGPEPFGLRFNHRFQGLADSFVLAKKKGVLDKSEILSCNPHAVLAVEIRYHDAAPDYLPEDSPWWKRNAQGKRILAWAERRAP